MYFALIVALNSHSDRNVGFKIEMNKMVEYIQSSRVSFYQYTVKS